MDGIEVSGAQTLFEIGPIAITETILSLIVVNAILLIAGILLGRDLKKRPGSLQVLTEKGVSMLMNLVEGTMGKHNMSWVPYIGTIFLSSILGSLIGLALSYIITGNLFRFLHTLITGGTVDYDTPMQMLFSPRIFIVTLLVCVLLNIASALLPAMFALKNNIVQSLYNKR